MGRGGLRFDDPKKWRESRIHEYFLKYWRQLSKSLWWVLKNSLTVWC